MAYAMDNAVDILLKRLGRVYLADIFLHIRVLKKLRVRKYERFSLFLSLDLKLEKEKKKEGQMRGESGGAPSCYEDEQVIRTSCLGRNILLTSHKNLMLRP
ncbi:hypothetical protein Peur_072903 [Populus x canadensis]|jgi:hypothetical protein